MKNWKSRAALFLISQCVTLFGSTLVQLGIVWYITLKTSSGGYVTLLTLCSFLPQAAMSLFGGAFADRYSKKKLIIIADAAIAVTTLALALIMPYIADDALLYVLILIVSALRSVGAGVQTPAVGAMIPRLVPEEQLMRFNGINSTVQSIIQFAAPAAAGAVMTLGTLNNTLYIDVATAVVGISVLAFIAVPCDIAQAPKAEGEDALSEIKEGVSYAAKTGTLRRALIIYGAFIFLSVPSGFLSALMVSRTFGESYVNLTVVEMVGFIGMVLGGVLLGTWGGFKSKKLTMLLGLALYGAFAVTLGLVTNFYVFAGAMLLMSFAIPIVQTAITTIIQETAQPQMHGRVFGLLGVMYSAFLPIGMALFGPLADVMPLNLLLVITGAALLLLAAAVLLKPSSNKNSSEK